MKIKKFKIILSLFLIIGIAAGGVLGYYDARLEAAVNNKNGSTLTDVKVDDNLTFNKNVINILLVGSDHGAIKGDHGRSDSIMIATVNFKTKELKLTSLMRDMYLDLPDGGMSNLNYTLNDGGAELLLKTINYNFDLAIDKFAQVNLHTLPIIIDKLGGLELNIDNDELNYINNYIDNIDSENNTSTEHITTTGTQLLNGTQVAAYCRIRYTSGGDYKRTERHRTVINALFNKFKNISLTEGLSLSNEILGLVSTNLTDSEIISIGSTLLSMNSASINQGRFPEDGDHYTEWTDMYHMIIDKETTREKLQSFLYE